MGLTAPLVVQVILFQVALFEVVVAVEVLLEALPRVALTLELEAVLAELEREDVVRNSPVAEVALAGILEQVVMEDYATTQEQAVPEAAVAVAVALITHLVV